MKRKLDDFENVHDKPVKKYCLKSTKNEIAYTSYNLQKIKEEIKQDDLLLSSLYEIVEYQTNIALLFCKKIDFRPIMYGGDTNINQLRYFHYGSHYRDTFENISNISSLLIQNPNLQALNIHFLVNSAYIVNLFLNDLGYNTEFMLCEENNSLEEYLEELTKYNNLIKLIKKNFENLIKLIELLNQLKISSNNIFNDPHNIMENE